MSVSVLSFSPSGVVAGIKDFRFLLLFDLEEPFDPFDLTDSSSSPGSSSPGADELTNVGAWTTSGASGSSNEDESIDVVEGCVRDADPYV